MKQKEECFYSCGLGYINTVVEGGTIEFMVDSGSMVNIIPPIVAFELGLKVTDIHIPLKGISGDACDITGVVEFCPIKIGSFIGPAHLFVATKSTECILGRPFLFDYKCTLAFIEKGEMLSFSAEDGRKIMVPLARNGRGFGWDKDVKFKKTNVTQLVSNHDFNSLEKGPNEEVEINNDTSANRSKHFL